MESIRPADRCYVWDVMIALDVSLRLSACIRWLSNGACCVYSPSPAVRSKLQLKCQWWWESTFHLEEAIRGTLFSVNAIDMKDKAKGQGSSTLCGLFSELFASFPSLPGRRIPNSAAAVAYITSLNYINNESYMKYIYSMAGLIKVA